MMKKTEKQDMNKKMNELLKVKDKIKSRAGHKDATYALIPNDKATLILSPKIQAYDEARTLELRD